MNDLSNTIMIIGNIWIVGGLLNPNIVNTIIMLVAGTLHLGLSFWIRNRSY